jgi:hypothetical protein
VPCAHRMGNAGRPPICCGSADACMMMAPLAASTLLRLAMAGPVYLQRTSTHSQSALHT